MSLQSVASAVAATFPDVPIQTPVGVVSLRAVMVAIAGAEDGWGNSYGDPLSIYRDGGTVEAAWSCQGYTSFGAFQVNLPANHGLVASLSGLGDPCSMAAWLADYGNAARAAYAIYRSQGLGAWTTYNTGAYLGYLSQAQQALVATQGRPTADGGTVPVNTPSQVPWGLIAVGAFILIFGVEEEAG